jgi:hypothetical protein
MPTFPTLRVLACSPFFRINPSLTLFGFSLRALFRQNIRVLGLASSIGALTYVLDYPKLELAADVLKSCFKLQENHSPFRAEFIVSQTARPRPAG